MVHTIILDVNIYIYKKQAERCHDVIVAVSSGIIKVFTGYDAVCLFCVRRPTPTMIPTCDDGQTKDAMWHLSRQGISTRIPKLLEKNRLILS